MKETRHYLGCIKPYEYWDIDPTSPGFLAGFLVAINSSNPLKTAPLSIYNHFPANVR